MQEKPDSMRFYRVLRDSLTVRFTLDLPFMQSLEQPHIHSDRDVAEAVRCHLALDFHHGSGQYSLYSSLSVKA